MDLFTLYLLAIGTLLIGAGMTFWEHRTNQKRSRSLRLLAGGFATLAVGCAAVLVRAGLPGMVASAISNLIILAGYLLILGGVAALRDQHYRARSAILLVGMALVWTAGGTVWEGAVWNYVSAIPIAVVSGMTAWEMLRCGAMKSLQSRYIVVAVTGIHTLLYAARAVVLPFMVTVYGQAVQSLAGKITIYEGVLYSVILPMALLRLMREETHGQLLRESQTDYLTRLGNRRWFFEEGTRIVNGAQRNESVSILAFDLDHFKAINDLHGHPMGDEVLKSFAETARSVLGDAAILARIGGEEFAALLRDDQARRARALGEAVAQRFARTISDRAANVGIRATVSIGLVQFERDVPPLGDGLAAADSALYRAKALGGNRLEVVQH